MEIKKTIPTITESKKEWNEFSADYVTNSEQRTLSVGINMLYTADFLTKKRILDSGCGSGKLSKYILSNISEDQKLYSTDFSENMVELTNNYLKDYTNKNIMLMDSHELKFENNFFDLYISNFIFHIVTDAEKCIQESYRVLNNNGILIFSVFGKESKSKFFTIYEEFFNRNNITQNNEIVSDFHMNKEKIRNILKNTGFKDPKFIYQDIIMPLDKDYMPYNLLNNPELWAYLKNKSDEEKNKIINDLSAEYKKNYEKEDFIGLNALICIVKK